MNFEHLINKCRSPVERMFLSGFAERDVEEVGTRHIQISSCVDGGSFIVVPQFKVELTGEDGEPAITVDFLLCHWRLDAAVAVEIDGHDWHERTKQQAQRDRWRDRALLRHGYHVIRFTGSEVWANAVACADEADVTLFEVMRAREIVSDQEVTESVRRRQWLDAVAAEEERLP